MIKIIRSRDPKSVEYMLPHLTLRNATEGMREKYLHRLALTMVNAPETVFLVQAWEGEDIVGFVVANVADEHVWVSQAWSKTGNPSAVGDEMFNRTILWAIALGRMTLRAETTRDIGAMFRRFKFEPITTIVEHRISPEVISKILERGKEYING